MVILSAVFEPAAGVVLRARIPLHRGYGADAATVHGAMQAALRTELPAVFDDRGNVHVLRGIREFVIRSADPRQDAAGAR